MTFDADPEVVHHRGRVNGRCTLCAPPPPFSPGGQRSPPSPRKTTKQKRKQKKSTGGGVWGMFVGEGWVWGEEMKVGVVLGWGGWVPAVHTVGGDKAVG